VAVVALCWVLGHDHVTGTALRLLDPVLGALENSDADEETVPQEPLPFFAKSRKREKGKGAGRS
jgi:hypothetical protein